ncbi:MAG: helix-turn-helix domain-containing protein [Bdellovibrionales bacterium]|jgi:transcriptional regulator with XRE-family HTH domain|nr:helix-turn-helix domain-containing protein [Bdellovibrionales bacterium]
MSKKMMDFLNEFDSKELTSGQLIRSFRTSKRLTLKDMEEITGMKSTNLSAIENDKISLGVHSAELLAAALGLHPTDILFPNGQWAKSKQILRIEKKSSELIKRKEKAV